MVTGVNSMAVGGGGGGALASAPSNGHSVAKNNNEISGISIIEPVKRSGDNRRSNKPIMEKRRRARINNCLNELKALILDANKKDPRHSKFEKADILEKTVKHLQDLQRQQSILTQATDPNVLNKFKAGFADCASEVGRFTGIDPVVRRRLLQHLSNCINGVKTNTSSSSSSSSSSSAAAAESSGNVHILPSPPSSPDQNNVDTMGGRHPAAAAPAAVTGLTVQQQAAASPFNHIAHSSNGYFLMNGNGSVGVQLIPTKLTNGNIAFVVPHGGLQHQQLPSSSPAAVASLQQLPILSNTPLPMLIPIPSRHSATSGHSSASSSSHSSTGTSPRRGQHPYSNNNVMPSAASPVLPQQQQRHVTSSPYDRSTETPTSNYGSMSPVNSHNRRSPIEQMDCQPSPGSSMGSPISPPCSPQSSSVIVRRRHQQGLTEDEEEHEMDMLMHERNCHSPVGPLSLVMRKSGDRDTDADSDKQCWRPW